MWLNFVHDPNEIYLMPKYSQSTVDDMNIYRDISVCNNKIIYYRYKSSLRYFIQVIYNVTVFALFFGFLKMSVCTDIASEESELSNDPSNI